MREHRIKYNMPYFTTEASRRQTRDKIIESMRSSLKIQWINPNRVFIVNCSRYWDNDKIRGFVNYYQESIQFLDEMDKKIYIA